MVIWPWISMDTGPTGASAETRSWTNWRIAGLPSKCCWRRHPGWRLDGARMSLFFLGWRWLKQHPRGSSLFDQLTKLMRIQSAHWKRQAEISIYNTDSPEPNHDWNLEQPGWWFGMFFILVHPVGNFITPNDSLTFFRGEGPNHQLAIEARQNFRVCLLTGEAMVLTAISLNYWLILFASAGWTGWSRGCNVSQYVSYLSIHLYLSFQPEKWDEDPQRTNIVFWVRFKINHHTHTAFLRTTQIRPSWRSNVAGFSPS